MTERVEVKTSIYAAVATILLRPQTWAFGISNKKRKVTERGSKMLGLAKVRLQTNLE